MIGADVLHDADVEAEHAPRVRRREPRVMRLLPRLVRARQKLGARLDPFDGPAEMMREQRDEHVLRIDPFLRAEPAAGVGCDDAHALGRQSEPRRDDAAQVIGRLVRRPHRHAAGDRIERRAEATRLDRHRGHAPVGRMVLDDHVGGGERAIDVADDLDDMADDVARALVDRRRGRRHRGFGVHDRGPRLVLDPDELGRVGGLVWIGTGHRDDRLADVAHFAARERRLRARRVQADIGVGPIRARGG